MSARAEALDRRSTLRRLHSLSGIVPIGGFLVFHLYENSAAARGADAYNEMAHRLQTVPFAVALEIFVIAVPLLFHGVYGLFLMTSPLPLPNGAARPGLQNLLSVLQRTTGVVAYAFLLFHYWTTRLVQIHDHESLDLFHQVQAAVGNPWIFAFYVIGILSAVFHLANGIRSFTIAWGLTVSPAGQRRMGYVSAAVFLALSVVGVRALAAFRL